MRRLRVQGNLRWITSARIRSDGRSAGAGALWIYPAEQLGSNRYADEMPAGVYRAARVVERRGVVDSCCSSKAV